MKPLTILTAAVLVSGLAQAQAVTQAQALERLFGAQQIKAEWFAPDFLAQIPLATIQAQMNDIRAAYGKFIRLDIWQDRPLAVFEKGTLLVTLASLDAQGRFTVFGAVPGPDQGGAAQPSAQDVQKGTALLTRLFTPAAVDTGLFSAEFLAQVPAAQLKQVFADMAAENGKLLGVEAQENGWRLTFEKGELDVVALTVNEQGLITGLRLAPAVPQVTFKSWDEARAAFAALPGKVSLLVLEVRGQARVNLNAAQVLAVGSTFKLAILGELQAQVKAGKHQWEEKVTLTDADKSLPSGTLQDAPAGSQYTLRELATRMIRDSDNTATDLLLRTVGRAGVEARLGQQAMPSTREAFALKNPANTALLQAYRAAALNPAARREALARAAQAPLPNPAVFARGGTLALDIEWYVSTQRLCALMADVADLNLMQMNPGVANPGQFSKVSFKGGSEPGVLNLTTQVTNKAGKSYCVSATWNRPQALNDTQFMALYQAVLNLAR